ncbi:alcohol oxidase [Mycena epipterygia]|nr:alcohol oxidase [Mycena epipterygia]
MFFLSVLTALVLARCSTAASDHVSNPSSSSSFTYVIVGGGTAGLTLAARLSEDASVSVLVLEAGEAHLGEPAILVPAEVGSVTGNPDYDWLYETVPQSHASNSVLAFTRGKILGGCSAVNAMIWDRSARPEYDFIAALGNPGWDWNGILPYLKKAENFTSPDPEFAKMWNLTFDPSTRGLSGPIKTAFTSFIPEAESAIQAAALEVGLDIIPEPFFGHDMGTWRGESSVDPVTRTRSYATTGYYLPNQDRPNLTVMTGAQVSKINWKKGGSGSGVTAAGVSYLKNGTLHSVTASREVILSASSIGSPQLLELSGVGNKSALKKLGIDSVVDLPGVGENMQDHIFVTLSYKLKSTVGTLDPLLSNATLFAEAEALLQATPASGGLTYTASGITMLGLDHFFLPSTASGFASLQKELAGVSRTVGQLQQTAMQFNWLHNSDASVVEVLSEGVHITPDKADPTAGYASFLVLLQQPFSRGSTHIKSSNITDHPTIDPKYFEIDFDLQVLSSAAQFVRNKLVKTPAWEALIVNENYPGPNVSTTAQIEAWVKSSIQSQSHTTGTCSMQPQAVGGVVDSTLKVHGTTNVRVVDLSVMPQQFSGHPQALVYSIAEKAADIIKSSYHH